MREEPVTRYRIPLTAYECEVALDALRSYGGSDPFGFDGDTMISDSEHRESLLEFCAGVAG